VIIVSLMSRWHRLRLSGLLLLALLALAGPAFAHVAGPAPAVLEAADPGGVPDLRAAPESPAVSGYLAAALALLAAVAWRRPRAAVVIGLVLLLGVFAFENALHSVHHGFDPEQEGCVVAAVAAQLAAVEAADASPAPVALTLAGRAEVTPSPLALSRFQSPDQGRAPPSAIL
jgi:hypothetical protein